MPACRIKTLKPHNLAPQEALRHPDYFEWRDIEAVPGKPLETSGCQNLRLECINCGWTVQGAVPPAVNGITVCPDCGDDLFQVTRLFERCTEPVPGFAIRRTKAGYIHIDGWQHLKDAAVYYTCNGEDPSAVDSRFTRPFKPDCDEDAEIRAVCYWGDSKSQVASLILQAPHPPKSYQCRYCKHFVKGYGDRIICPTCGVARVMYANGAHADEAPAFKCPSCGAEHLVAGLDAMLHCVTCGAEYQFSREWVFCGWRIACPACGQSFFIQQLDSPDGTCTCRSCHSVLAFDAQYGNCWRALSTPQPPQPRKHENPKPQPKPQPSPPKEKEDNAGCWIYVIVLILLAIIRGCNS